ncbi:exodeoxyribonuclease VII small subunit [Bombilactobacillus thymidiniphilus]|uniref:Exodeoxyribonuclease 7 small subunit n=1 Tax=Bombilactobacillus thymidiniphilus TaxID=2923363 RepID=A0ABY4PCG2_9LACO|nr:exodeoxyribonuclease VII small subunit [Bombilactobacillus thymidiniphilus]UQS83450.1 exodeoxyribonuclease VII small subunit [Bombilactobacillus thymidiniphilus]
MTEKKQSFEDNLNELQQIVEQLQQGDIPLEKAMDQFQKGVKLSKKLEQTLTEAENKLTQVVDEDGGTSTFNLPADDKRDETDE